MRWENARLIHVAKVDNLRYDCNFITTNDDTVWKDTPDSKSVNLAFQQKDEKGEHLQYNQVDHISWEMVRILPGFTAKIDGTNEYKSGDSPHEAVKYLDFPNVYSIDRDPITTSDSLNKQIIDILQYHTGSVHYTIISKYLNYSTLDIDTLSNEETKEILGDIETSDSVYRTTDSDSWWSYR